MKDVKITQFGKEKADVIIDFIKYLLFFYEYIFLRCNPVKFH